MIRKALNLSNELKLNKKKRINRIGAILPI